MPAKKKVGTIISVPAPIGGWNVRDPLPAMEPQYAPILDNVFCLPSELMVRKGWKEWATFDGICKTIMDYDAASGEEMLLAAVDNAGDCTIYDVSTAGVADPVVTDLTSAQFKHCHFATSGGYFTYFVNSSDAAILFDGTTFQTVTTASSPYAITNVTDTVFSDVISHKRRLWFVPNNSLKVYYLPTDQIAGEAQPYDFAPIFSKGGHIVKLDTWSLDAGQGLDDYMVVFTSEGEVAVYTGTDPASMSTWSLQGVFYIGTPTGNGHTAKYGGDLLIINKDGLAQMSKSLMSSRVNTWLQLTDKIQPQLAQDTTDYQDNTGWDLTLFPPANMLIVNIPVKENNASYQYVMNTISGAWSRWTGINAFTWYYAQDQLWAGMDGKIGQMWTINNDNGHKITAEILPAYQSLGQNSQLKRWTMGRVLFGTNAAASYGARMEVDFNLSPYNFTLPIPLNTPGAVYDFGKYDECVYGGSLTVKKTWQNISGMGYWGSLHIKIQTFQADIRIYSYDIMVEAGGNI